MEYEECEALTSFDLARDAILFGLRMNEGICLAEIARSFGLETIDFEPVAVFLNRLEREGLGLEEPLKSKLLTLKCDLAADEKAVKAEKPEKPQREWREVKKSLRKIEANHEKRKARKALIKERFYLLLLTHCLGPN